ncbi:unnamed protein product, partial [Sphacelaria rigidula]
MLDITSGYFNVAIHQDSIPLTAICTQSGLYEWLVMPMGCSGSPGWFQEIMARICDGLERCRLYIDDVCTFSGTGKQHVDDLEGLFQRLTKYNLKLAPKKAHVGMKETKFLGRHISAEGISPDQDKVQVLIKMPVPADVSQLRPLLGGLGYYQHGTIAKEMLSSLTGTNVLAFSNYEDAALGKRPFMLTTDASLDGLGAVVEQRQEDNTVRPLIFLSRGTLPDERNWSVSELEAAAIAAAIVWAIKKNRRLLYGVPFEIYADHQPLRNLLSLAEKVPRVQRWHDFLSAYTYEIKYKPGRVNANADMLSRLPQPPDDNDMSGDARITDPD